MTTEQPQKRGRGRPRKDPNAPETRGTPEERAAARLALMQKTVDDICGRIVDAPHNYVTRAVRSRATFTLEQAMAGMDAMEAAIADARTTLERAYVTEAKSAVEQTSRVAFE